MAVTWKAPTPPREAGGSPGDGPDTALACKATQPHLSPSHSPFTCPPLADSPWLSKKLPEQLAGELQEGVTAVCGIFADLKQVHAEDGEGGILTSWLVA